MARVPTEELERIKREISLVRLVEACGVKLSGNGDNLIGLCPLHPDRSPSLVVSPSKNVFHCLGVCQTGGSVIDWVMKTKRVSFRLAVEMLRKESPSLVADSRPTTRPQLEPLTAPQEADAVVMRRTVDYYHETFKDSVEAQEYLRGRGITHAEVVEHFKIGYANRTLGYRLPKAQLHAGAEIRLQLQRLGLYRESGHEHFRGCVVFPIFGSDGEVKELYGRKINDKRQPHHLYLPSRPGGRGIFNEAAFQASKDLILCESILDALAFWCAGFRNVTTAYGVEGFTPELRAALAAHGTEKLLIAYDRDDAGDKAAEKLASELGQEGLEIFRVLFPRAMDANAYALKVTPANKSLETALRGAEWMAGTRPVSVLESLEASAAVMEAAQASAAIEPPAESPCILAAAAEEPAEAPHDPITGELLPAALPPPRPAGRTAAALRAELLGLTVEERKHEVRVMVGDRQWRIRGLAKNTSYEALRLNLMVTRGEAYFVDVFEVYLWRQRSSFVKQAAAVLKLEESILDSDVGKLVLWLEDRIHQQIEGLLEIPEKTEMSAEARAAALELLRDPKLTERIVSDFDQAGMVGEEENKLIGYLAAVSRKLEAPLAVVVQSSSAAGKSSLMDAVLRFMPEEERIQFSAMTGQSLFYMGEEDLSHKILAIAEEEGAQSASYALKLLQSEGELNIASTGKNPVTGRLVTHPYSVKGPVMIFMTTTAVDVDEELLNRCLVLSVDEGAQQTSAIHERQREQQTLEGLFQKQDRDAVVELHQNAQRLIEPLFVVNPIAKSLRFSHHATRTRRDHMKYLTLIRAIALLHQHQRPIKEVERHGKTTRYIEVTEADVALADRLAKGLILPSLDELPPQTLRLLELVDAMVTASAKAQGIEKSEVRFSRKDIRHHTRWSDSALKKHVARLEALEHFLVHSGGSRKRIVYQLAYEYGGNWSPLEGNWSPQNANWSPPNGNWSPPGHGLVTPGGRPDSLEKNGQKHELVTPGAEMHIRAGGQNRRTYVKPNGRAS